MDIRAWICQIYNYSVRSLAAQEFYYEITDGDHLTGKIVSGVRYDFKKQGYYVSEVHDQKSIRLFNGSKKKLQIYIDKLEAKQPTDYSGSINDVPIITVVLNGKKYKTILVTSDFERQHPDLVDSDVLRLMEQLMEIAPFPNDKRWGGLYQWYDQNT